MPIDFSFDKTILDTSVDALGLEVYYSIDNSFNESFTNPFYNGVVHLSHISNGTHQLSAYVQAPYVYNNTIFTNTQKLFTLNFKVQNYPPNITITSIQNKTYTTPDLMLVVKVDTQETVEDPEFRESNKFSLDGKGNETFSQSVYLTGLANGQHILTVYTSTYGGSSSKTVYFTVKTTLEKTTETTPIEANNTLIVPTAIGIVSITVLSVVALLLYRRHRKAVNLKQ
jgi:hypothetical protein